MSSNGGAGWRSTSQSGNVRERRVPLSRDTRAFYAGKLGAWHRTKTGRSCWQHSNSYFSFVNICRTTCWIFRKWYLNLTWQDKDDVVSASDRGGNDSHCSSSHSHQMASCFNYCPPCGTTVISMPCNRMTWSRVDRSSLASQGLLCYTKYTPGR